MHGFGDAVQRKELALRPANGARVQASALPYGRRLWLARRGGYVLLETTIATALLLVGMAIIGAQLQESNSSVRGMDRRMRALMLAEMQIAEMDLGLIDLDTLDEIVEEDFGPRYPDWAWRMTIEKTAIENMLQLRLDVLYAMRDSDQEDFDFEYAEILHTVYAMRPIPQPLDLQVDFGLSDDDAASLGERLSRVGEGFDLNNFDPRVLGQLPPEELVEVLPLLLTAFQVPLDQIKALAPPDVLAEIQKLGLLDALSGDAQPGDAAAPGDPGGGEDEGQE